MRNWSVDDAPRLDDHVIVVTGANSGLGFEATRMFAQRGATVVMACRSTERANDARRELQAENPDGKLDVRECNLADLQSVRTFAAGVRETYDSIDVLCNNAGVMAIPRSETTDGFETQFGVNHLGHFALTGLVLDLLRAGDSEARVVTQSSGMHERGEMDFDDLHGERRYDKWDAYGQSKLANVLFAYELQRRLDAAGIDEVTSVAVHPGYANTNLQARTGRESGSKLVYAAMQLANAVFAQSARKGALPMLYAAVVDGLDGGSYVGPGGFLNMRGAPDVQRSSDRSYDRDTATRLWTVSEDATGVTYDLPATVANG